MFRSRKGHSRRLIRVSIQAPVQAVDPCELEVGAQPDLPHFTHMG